MPGLRINIKPIRVAAKGILTTYRARFKNTLLPYTLYLVNRLLIREIKSLYFLFGTFMGE